MGKKLYNDCFDKFLFDCEGFKEKSARLSVIFENSNSPTIRDRANKIYRCGTLLQFGVSDDDITLDNANFCRQRLCPMCQWRRSRRLYADLSALWERLIADGYNFVHVVLTVRNVCADDLDGTINRMYRNFSRMLHDNAFCHVQGAIRFLEVTYNVQGDNYHPHLHVLLVVRKSYFTSRYYISHPLLVSLWRQYMRLDYDPLCHIGKADSGSIQEVSKYCVKPFDFDALDWRTELLVYETLDIALHGRRMIQTYGVIRSILRDLKIDLESDEEDVSLVDPDTMTLQYNALTRRYEYI